jgi:transposase-like protein
VKERHHYSEEVRRRAKIMWLSGNYSSDKDIAKELGVSRPNTIAEWRKKENWHLERTETVNQINRRVGTVLQETIAEMQRRHLREYQAMQSKGIQALAKHDARSVVDAVNLIDTGVKGERLVRGEPSEIREIRQVMEYNVELVVTVVGDLFRDLLAQRRVNRETARWLAEQFAERINRTPFKYELPDGT